MSQDHDHPRPDEFRFDEDRHVAAVTCRHVWKEGRPILLVSHEPEGDWQFFCGDAHDASDCALLCLEHVVSLDPSVNELATMCTGHLATREHAGASWTIEDGTFDHIRRTIDEHGWWIGLIAADEEGPGFAYTIGLYETFGHPEIIVFGLPRESMHGILNQCGDLIRGGARFDLGVSVSGIIDGYDVKFRPVTSQTSHADYLGYACRHYDDDGFPVLQLLWPDKQHRFPGDPSAADFLAQRQPVLA